MRQRKRFDEAGRGLLIWLLGTLLLFSTATQATGLDAQLDRTRIGEGETVTLTLSLDGGIQGTPDLSPLGRDFEILDRRQGTRMSIVNGRSSSTREWALVLAPKRTGRLEIPPLRAAAVQSEALTLEVLPAGSAPAGGSPPEVLLEVEADPESAYVQSQVTYRVRVLSRVPLRQASLSEPGTGDALVERLGEDRSFHVYRDGVRYSVIERRYALFPQHSGPLTVQGPALAAAVPREDGGRRSLAERMFGRDPFGGMPDLGGMFEETRAVRMRGRDLTLEVRPRPAAAGAPWLPARDLTLTEEWTPDPAQTRVGEPLTRTLTIEARGLAAAQLPDLEAPAGDGLKVYPDKAQGESRGEGEELVARKRIKVALVPTRAGRLELPELRLPWWDIQADAPREAVLPGRVLEVLPGTGPASVAPPAPAPAPAADRAPGVTAADGPPAVSADPWPWIAAALGIAWLATLGLWWRERHRQGTSSVSRTPATAPRTVPDLGMLGRTLKSGDPRSARRALLNWAAARWPDRPPRGLDRLAERLDDPAAREVLEGLDARLYGADGAPWDGAAAWAVLEPILKLAPRESPGERSRDPLPPLYPPRPALET